MGAVFAGLIFAISVVSIPMILHRQTDAITAGLTSMRLVLTQPGVDAVVGAADRAAGGPGAAAAFAGLLVAGPVVRPCQLACLPRRGGRLTPAMADMLRFEDLAHYQWLPLPMWVLDADQLRLVWANPRR